MSNAFFDAVFPKHFENTQFKNNIAIIDKTTSKHVSYLELYNDVMAMQLFIRQKLLNKLSGNNLHPHGVIALNLSKSYQFIVSQLSCSYLGYPFLPLDTNQEYRNQEILNMIQPILVISDNEIIRRESYQPIDKDCDYVIFSSGSTGNPKGILMKGLPAIHIVSQQAKIINIQPGEKYLWLLSPAFDASLSDIYSTLVSRATLVIPNFDTVEIKKLCQSLSDDKISYMDLPPSMFSLFDRTRKHYFLPHLKGIIFGGETAPEKITQLLSQEFNLYQAYGPTETTICSSMKKLNENSIATDIGKALDGVMYQVIDNELLISGDILSLGYFNNEELNTSRFIDIDGITWFKTGDCVSYESGMYIYKGRLDRQFKFHSQLICPEEIEAKALTYGASFSHVHFDDKIHIYYQGDLDLENFKKSLANYMIPHFFHQVNHIQNLKDLLNPNHKFDHKSFLKNIE